MNPWVTKRIAKSSKKKQKLYEKILKKRNPENEKIQYRVQTMMKYVLMLLRNSKLGHYRPISVFTCFSKILECVMYNRI